MKKNNLKLIKKIKYERNKEELNYAWLLCNIITIADGFIILIILYSDFKVLEQKTILFALIMYMLPFIIMGLYEFIIYFVKRKIIYEQYKGEIK